MIVMPSLTEREQGNPPGIGRPVRRSVAAITHVMGRAIDEPRRVIRKNEAREDSPHDTGPAADRKKRGSERYLQR